MKIIEVSGLTKKYGNFTAVDNVSFTVEEGTIFGLLGPNGAGKSTTIECMIGIKKPNAGSIRILDMDVLKIGKKIYDYIGVQLQETAYQDKIKVKELCDFFATMYSNPLDYKPLLEKFGLKDKHEAYVNDLSGGQKQKVAITLALIANPKVVFLDELTTGLDPKARREMWELVKELKEEGRTVFLTTHYMEEAAYLCDKIGIIDLGKLLIIDNVDGVIEHANLNHQVSFEGSNESKKKLEEKLKTPAVITYEAGFIKVASKHEDIISHVIMTLNEHQIDYRKIELSRPSLEDAYLQLTGKTWEA